MRPFLSAIALLLLLAACATPSAETIAWARDGTSTEDARGDLHACTRDAQAQSDREHDAQGLAGQQPTDVGASIDAFNQSIIIATNNFNLSPVTTVAILFVVITIPQARLVDRLIERDRRRMRIGG